MKDKNSATTRRDFLKQSAGIAGTVILSGFGVSCVVDDSLNPIDQTQTMTPLTGRQQYMTFSKSRIGGMTLKNRLVRSAAMISAARDGRPTDDYIDVYKKLAEGGVGLIITGFMIPSRQYASTSRQMHIYDDSHVQGLRNVADAVHDAAGDCKLFAQIGLGGTGISPSGIRWPMPGRRAGRILSVQEIEAIVTDFAEAIRRVKESGFDGAELHGAHAYLLSTFLSPSTNQRNDRYGGSVQNRVQIVREIMNQSRKYVGNDYPIIIKLNSDDNTPDGIRPENFQELVTAIEDTGIDAIDVSGNDCLKQDIDTIDDETYFLRGARTLSTNTPIIVTGGNRSIDHMEGLIQQTGIDFFGLARPLIREPDLPDRWLAADGEGRATCISCNGCFNRIGSGPVRCIQEV